MSNPNQKNTRPIFTIEKLAQGEKLLKGTSLSIEEKKYLKKELETLRFEQKLKNSKVLKFKIKKIACLAIFGFILINTTANIYSNSVKAKENASSQLELATQEAYQFMDNDPKYDNLSEVKKVKLAEMYIKENYPHLSK